MFCLPWGFWMAKFAIATTVSYYFNETSVLSILCMLLNKCAPSIEWVGTKKGSTNQHTHCYQKYKWNIQTKAQRNVAAKRREEKNKQVILFFL